MKFDFKRAIRYFNYRTPSGVSIKVLRDWKVVFYCFIVFALLFSVMDIFLFLKYREEMKSEIGAKSVQEEPLIMVDRNSLDSVLDELKRKEVLFEKKMSAPKMKNPAR